MDSEFDYILNARWFVNPENFEVFEDQQVCVRDGRIVALKGGRNRVTNDPDILDYGDAVILPAFVNCHTHLDLSHMRGLPLTGDDFGKWLSAVIQSRSAPISTIVEGTRSAVNELLRTGTCAVLDILALNQGARDVAQVILESHLQCALAVEFLALNPDQEPEVFSRALGLVAEVQDLVLAFREEDLSWKIERFHDGERLPDVALSPHAPYSVSPRLYRRIAEYAARNLLLQTTHLSESRAEREFLAHHKGELLELYRFIGVDTDRMRWGTGTPVETWLEATRDTLQRGVNDTVLVHCYDLIDAEVHALGRAGATVAYCPRSRAYFGHPDFRFMDLMKAGARVVFGTDSLGSNDNLDMLQELKAARDEQPGVTASELFRAATVHGRQAIQYRTPISDQVNRVADLQVIAAPEGASKASILEELIQQRPLQLATMIHGVLRFNAM